MNYAADLKEQIVTIVKGFPIIVPENKEHYLGALQVCYHSMVASEPLLKLAAEMDSHHKNYFIRHEKEERGHEVWMRRDIFVLGGHVYNPPLEIITMCGEMYYKIRHMSAAHLLGYMAVIEGFPNSPEMIARIKKLYPGASFTLEYHAENDVKHGEELDIELNKIPRAFQEDITETALRTATLYRDALWRMVLDERN